MINVEVTNRQSALSVDAAHLQEAVVTVLQGESVQAATVSLAIVDDRTIHRLNQRYLQHDYPTDVLSFLLDDNPLSLEGEVIVSAETACRVADSFAWSPGRELLLYVIHGTLHLVGYDDHDPIERRRMRSREREYLVQLGCPPPSYEDEPQGDDVG